MLNILIDLCNSDKRITPKLIYTVLIEKTVNRNGNSKIISPLNNLFDNKIKQISKVRLVHSDAALYGHMATKMIKK